VTIISRNQQNKLNTRKIIPRKQNKNNSRKMHVFNCSCGVKILIDRDLPAMNEAIKNHIVEHEKLTGQCLTEDVLREDILKAVVKAINKT
jgi:hypothetical protein